MVLLVVLEFENHSEVAEHRVGLPATVSMEVDASALGDEINRIMKFVLLRHQVIVHQSINSNLLSLGLLRRTVLMTIKRILDQSVN